MKERHRGYQLKEQRHFDKLARIQGEAWWGSITPAGIRRLKRRALLVSQAIRHFKDPVVLEIGCGTGALTGLLLKELPTLRLLCCDISLKSIQIASKRYGEYKNVSFEAVDVTSKHYPADRFDCVIGNSVLHHLPMNLILGECFRILRPGGMIFFFEPNMMNPEIAVLKNIRFIGRIFQDTDNETAFFRWPLMTMLRNIGFEKISVQPFDFLHPIVPQPVINITEGIGKLLEKTPLLKEISGSLLICAYKNTQEHC